MNKVSKHMEICEKLNKIYEAKNTDYGDSFGKTFDKWGPTMAAIRLEDKLQRFERLITNDAKVKDESIKDTLIDLANYSIMTLIEMERVENELSIEGPGKLARSKRAERNVG